MQGVWAAAMRQGGPWASVNISRCDGYAHLELCGQPKLDTVVKCSHQIALVLVVVVVVEKIYLAYNSELPCGFRQPGPSDC